MKKSRLFSSIITPGIVLALALMYAGCEDEPSMSELDRYFENHPYISDPRTDPSAPVLAISPQSATVTVVGDQVQFSVRGGASPYTWDVADNAVGTIAVGGGYSDAVYTCTTLGENSVIVSDSNGHAAIAQINGNPSGPAIVPTSASLYNNGNSLWLIAEGGTMPYVWSVVYPGRGTITTISADTTTIEYRRDTVGDNTVVVEDYHRRTSTATISQGDPTPPVISPATATLQTNQTSVAFEVTGGTAPYVWSIVTGTGSVNPPAGSQTVYTKNPADPPDNYFIKVTDANALTDMATITQY